MRMATLEYMKKIASVKNENDSYVLLPVKKFEFAHNFSKNLNLFRKNSKNYFKQSSQLDLKSYER